MDRTDSRCKNPMNVSVWLQNPNVLPSDNQTLVAKLQPREIAEL